MCVVSEYSFSNGNSIDSLHTQMKNPRVQSNGLVKTNHVHFNGQSDSTIRRLTQ